MAAEVARRSHNLQSSPLKTSLCSFKKNGVDVTASSSSLEFEMNKLLLLNIPRDVVEEMLQLYIQTHARVDVESLEISRENSRALVVLTEPCGKLKCQILFSL